MSKLILIEIDSVKQQKINIRAFDKETAHVYIAANELSDVEPLLSQGFKDALAACEKLEAPSEKIKQKKQSNSPEQKMKQFIKDFQYSSSASEMQFAKLIQKARDFVNEKEARNWFGRMSINQYRYLSYLTFLNIDEGLNTLYSIGFRRGYDCAKKERKQQKQ